jgi:hypothetical protein
MSDDRRLWSALIKIAPIVSTERVNDPTWTRPGRVLFWSGSLSFLPGRSTIPLVIDHDVSRQVGTVHDLFTMDWIDGPWICARATLDNPPGWLKPYTTRASFGRLDVSESERVSRAFVKEVTLCLATEPNEPGAELVSLKRTEATQSTGEEIIDTKPMLLVRPGIGHVIGIR